MRGKYRCVRYSSAIRLPVPKARAARYGPRKDSGLLYFTDPSYFHKFHAKIEVFSRLPASGEAACACVPVGSEAETGTDGVKCVRRTGPAQTGDIVMQECFIRVNGGLLLRRICPLVGKGYDTPRAPAVAELFSAVSR